jgi:murein DD-endopeptidase MepM/ murein hydrolase activator NlpD
MERGGRTGGVRWAIALRVAMLSFAFLLYGLARASPLENSPSPDDSIAPPARLAIYYGYPSLVNGDGSDLDAAADSFAKFDLVVLGDGLEHSFHEDHANTRAIVAKLNVSGTLVFGYVDLGVTTQNLPLPDLYASVDEWAAMGAAGIFFDDAGHEYGVDRPRLTAAISYVHSLDLQVFVNAWYPEDVFEDDPPGSPTPLEAGDWYLAEGHPVSEGQCSDLEAWWSKSQALDAYRTQTGVKVAGVSTGDDGSTGWANDPVFRQSLWAAYLFDLDAFGFTNPQYSASGAGDNRLRPLPPLATGVGDSFTGPPAGPAGSPPAYTRTTSNGVISVWSEGGTFRGGACNTTELGDRIWPTCSASPPAQSSPFGPRQMASESDRYDWHRGVDIPQSLGVPVYATMDGIVRIAGTHPAYSDTLVQIRHRDSAPYLYSNYLHMSDTVVLEGDLVTAGDLIGHSGASITSGFPHIHFEFRDGCLYQDCNRNPWGYLPYTGVAPLTPTLAGANFSISETLLLLEAETPAGQLDLDGMDLSWGTDSLHLEFNEVNGTTDRDFPQGLDHPLVHLSGTVDVCLQPGRFNASSPAARYRMAFQGLDAAATAGEAAQRDLNGAGPVLALVLERPPLTLDPASREARACLGDTLVFTHTLRNVGPDPLTLTLAATSTQSNSLALSHRHLSLPPGSSQAITLTVTLSTGFPMGVGDCIVLEANIGTGTSVIALETAITCCCEYYLPLVLKGKEG